MKKEYLEFITEAQTPPSYLKEMARKDIALSFQGKVILQKFIAYQILGALISLSFCPQFGLSFFVEGHGITHVFRQIGDWACALFCGTLFLSVGIIIAFFSMKGEELWWVFRRKKIAVLALPAVFWGILMSLNLSLALPSEKINYHLTWLLTAVMIQFFCLKLRSLFFKQTL